METLTDSRYYSFVWNDGEYICINDLDSFDFLNDE